MLLRIEMYGSSCQVPNNVVEWFLQQIVRLFDFFVAQKNQSSKSQMKLTWILEQAFVDAFILK